jgi:hypothetical protein
LKKNHKDAKTLKGNSKINLFTTKKNRLVVKQGGFLNIKNGLVNSVIVSQ